MITKRNVLGQFFSGGSKSPFEQATHLYMATLKYSFLSLSECVRQEERATTWGPLLHPLLQA